MDAAIPKGFGMVGALTSGVVRDPGDMPPDFPVIAGSVGPCHGFVHVREIGTSVTGQLAAAIARLEATEHLVPGPVSRRSSL